MVHQCTVLVDCATHCATRCTTLGLCDTVCDTACCVCVGELISIWIDSCALLGSKYPWFIRDATDAFTPVHQGEGDIHELIETQPY